MNKRDFLKSGLYAAGGLSLSGSNLFAKPTAPALSNDFKSIAYLPNTSDKREKVLEALDQSKPNKYVPAAFFMHFPEKLGQPAVSRHLDYFRATNMDFVKVQYEITLPRMDNITRPEDWANVPVYTKDFFEPQLAVIEALAKELRHEALIIPTVYSPFSLASQVTDLKKFVQHGKENPNAVAKGVKNMTESTLNYVHEAINRGADGFYIATQGGEANNFGDGDIFAQLIEPYDMMVLNECADKTAFNILHICDYHGAYSRLNRFVPYPASVINPPYVLADGTLVKTKDVQEAFKRPVMGGLNRNGVIAKGTEAEILAEVDKVMSEAAQNIILAADCTVPGEVPWQTLRTVIDYAHNWRLNH